MDLRRLMVMARTWLPLMVVAAVMAGAAAFVVSNLQQKVYEAKATLIVGQALSAANPDYTQLLVAQNLSATYATIAKTRPVLESVIKALDLDETPSELATRLEVNAPRDSALLTIAVQDTVPARAAAIANALAEQLVAVSPTIQGRAAAFQKSIDQDVTATQSLIEATQARVDALIAVEDRTADQEAELQALEGRLASLRSTYATLLSFSSGSPTNLLTVVEPADTPASSVWPRTLLNTLLAAAFGLMVVVGIAFLLEQLDDTIKDPDTIQDVAGLSTLGTIARLERSRPVRNLPARWTPLSAFKQCRGLPHAPRECRIRLRGCATAHPPCNKCSPGRGEDRDGVEPRRRLRTSRANGPPRGCRPSEARSALDVRPAQHPRSDNDVA